MSVTSKTLIAVSFIASLGAVSTAANAEEITVHANSRHSIEVSYSDLNLDNAYGQRTLESRISAAAKKVCGSTTGRISLKESTQIRSCVRGSTETATASLNSTGKVQVAARSLSNSGR